MPNQPDETGTPRITHHAYLTSAVDKGPLFVMHHGAGSSGLSFAVVGSEIRKKLPSAGILALDARGHGSTVTTGDAPLDYSLETLRIDLFSAIRQTQQQMGWKELPPIVLVGHSLGGAVVTDLAKSYALGNTLLGYAVMDVVEGSAMDALQSMTTYLSTRPTGFVSVQAGIDWHIRSRTIRNSTSARASVPALLTEMPGGSRPWKWRTNLAATEPFWSDWFIGLSRKFLEAKGGKMLILAGTDRLDKELTIGQMQGTVLMTLGWTISRLTLAQANTHCTFSQRRDTLCTRTSLKTQQWCSLTFTGAMIEAPWCCHPRYRTCWRRERGSDGARYLLKQKRWVEKKSLCGRAVVAIHHMQVQRIIMCCTRVDSHCVNKNSQRYPSKRQPPSPPPPGDTTRHACALSSQL